jgi:hypothetical protein
VLSIKRERKLSQNNKQPQRCDNITCDHSRPNFLQAALAINRCDESEPVLSAAHPKFRNSKNNIDRPFSSQSISHL